MFLQSQPRPEPTDESLWLVIQQGGKRVRCFELRANCHRAIAVGSARNADFRVEGAPPVAFYLEREDAAVWVTPAYISDDLRVDTQKLDARRRLHRLSKVEFSSISLELVIRDTPPTLRGKDVPTAAGEGAELEDAFREFEANRELTATRELEPWHVAPGVLNPVTGEYSRSDLLPPEAFRTATLELNRRELEQLFEDGEPKDDEQLRTTRRLFLGCESREGLAIEPQPTIDVAPQPAALRLDDPFGDSGRTNEYWPPRQVPPGPKGSGETRRTKAHAVTATEVERQERSRTALVLKPEPPRVTMVAKLGLLTKQRPLAVLASAMVGAIAMSIFLVGAVEVFGRHALHHASRSVAVPVKSQLATASSPEDREVRPIEPQAIAQSSVDHEELSQPKIAPSSLPSTRARSRRAAK